MRVRRPNKTLNTHGKPYQRIVHIDDVDDEFISVMIDYFVKNAESHETLERKNQDGEIIGKRFYPKPLATMEGFAKFYTCKHKKLLSSRILYDWAIKKDEEGKPKYPDFEAAYRFCLDDVKLNQLREGMIFGVYQFNTGILELKNRHEYKDKTEKEFSGEIGGLKVIVEP